MAEAALAGVKRWRLRDFSLGFASADFEASHEPDLLLRGFIDPQAIIEEVRFGRRFLILGHKGSGKSAVGEHMRLLASTDPSLFVKFINIADISFTSFSQILKGTLEPEARYPLVWSWLLMLFLLDSFRTDEGSNYASEDDLFLSIESLNELGLLPSPRLGNAITTTLESTFSLKLSTVLGSFERTTKRSKSALDLPFFVDRLRDVACSFRSDSKHLLIIDGFDELLRRGNLQYDALGCLIFECNRLNMRLVDAGVPAKIIVLCRTDLFERLPGPNKNKVRQDSAIHIWWFDNSRAPEKSHLVNLVNHRASLGYGKPIDVFDTFLPATLSTYRDKDIRGQLLDHTRHIPRDMIMLFKKLQEFSGDGAMTVSQVDSGLAACSRDHFLPEIIDELDGYVEADDIQRGIHLLGSVRKQTPTLFDLKQQATVLSYPPSFNLEKLLNGLFECSAIGNIASTANGRAYVTFKFRNRHATFNATQRILVHRGLWKALNLNP